MNVIWLYFNFGGFEEEEEEKNNLYRTVVSIPRIEFALISFVDA
jgi:hypothetical protein